MFVIRWSLTSSAWPCWPSGSLRRYARAKTVQAEAERANHRLQDTAGELVDAQAQIEQFREQQATLRQEIADLVAARAELAERLAAETERTEHQRHRAEAAEQQASRASGPVEYPSAELITPGSRSSTANLRLPNNVTSWPVSVPS
jgi:septal ring factor EnvC (AmiA/AmiB activator)